MTDREFLEAASTALLESLPWFASKHAPIGDDGVIKDWNPLEDDGDALRLMAWLGLVVTAPCMRLDDDQAEAKDYDSNFVCIELADEEHDGDPAQATRRAIVRAAAALGGAA